VPAGTPTTDERFARALAFERGARTRAVARVEPLPYGEAFFQEALSHVYWANLLWVTARDGVGYGELAAEADRLFGGFAHRQVVIQHESLWSALEDEFVAGGWERDAILYMTHERPPDRMPEDWAAVHEVGHDDVRAAEAHFLRDEPGTTTPEARSQVMRHNRHIGELLDERCFAAFADDAVCAYAKLRHVDGVAQVEDVAVAPEHRGAGLGRLVTSAALAAGLALAPELLFIVADEEDWPRELYGRLGFEPAGRIRGFLRPPPSDPRSGADASSA
jgi:ribosomal protein S18 acetylase RimI-like enzyme